MKPKKREEVNEICKLYLEDISSKDAEIKRLKEAERDLMAVISQWEVLYDLENKENQKLQQQLEDIEEGINEIDWELEKETRLMYVPDIDNIKKNVLKLIKETKKQKQTKEKK